VLYKEACQCCCGDWYYTNIEPKEAAYVEPSGVQALKNPNPLKDVEALAVLGVAVLV